MVSERKSVWKALVGSIQTHKQKKTNSEKGQKEMVRIQMPKRDVETGKVLFQ